MFSRQQAVEYGDGALKNDLHWRAVGGESSARTCRRSSKSLAAIFFSSELFRENFRIVLFPKVGTCLYLKERHLQPVPGIMRTLTVGRVHEAGLHCKPLVSEGGE